MTLWILKVAPTYLVSSAFRPMTVLSYPSQKPFFFLKAELEYPDYSLRPMALASTRIKDKASADERFPVCLMPILMIVAISWRMAKVVGAEIVTVQAAGLQIMRALDLVCTLLLLFLIRSISRPVGFIASRASQVRIHSEWVDISEVPRKDEFGLRAQSFDSIQHRPAIALRMPKYLVDGLLPS